MGAEFCGLRSARRRRRGDGVVQATVEAENPPAVEVRRVFVVCVVVWGRMWQPR